MVDFGHPGVLRIFDTETRASQFLTDRGVALTEAARTSFLFAVAREFSAATKTLERRASGDWSEDKHLDQVAAFEPLTSPSISGNGKLGSVASSTGVSPPASASQLFEAYILDKQPKTSTISRWRVVFTALDAAREADGPDWDAQQWLDSLRTENRSARTVRDIWLSAARTVFAWAVRKRRVPANPFEGCTVEVPRTSQTRETEKEFENIMTNVDFLKTLDRGTFLGWLFNTLVASVTCLKHEGFLEEREWRAIYDPTRVNSPLMTRSTVVIGGIPQFVYQIPLDKAFSPDVAGLDLATIFDRLIIGPSPYPWVMYEAFTDALKAAGVADANKRVWISGIPIRA